MSATADRYGLPDDGLPDGLPDDGLPDGLPDDGLPDGLCDADLEEVVEAMAAHREMIGAIERRIANGADPDDVFWGHELLDAFSDMLDELPAQSALSSTDRSRVARAVLTDMAEALERFAAAVAPVDPHSRASAGRPGAARIGAAFDAAFDAACDSMTALFRELAPCIPRSVEECARRQAHIEWWLLEHPEVSTAVLEETSASSLGPGELIAALQEWMTGLDDEEVDALQDRFVTDPEGVVRECMRRAALSALIDAASEGLISLDEPGPADPPPAPPSG